MKKEIKAITAYAVVSSTLRDYYTYDGRDGELMSHAIFPRKKEALKFAQFCCAQYGDIKPKVIIKVLITPQWYEGRKEI